MRPGCLRVIVARLWLSRLGPGLLPWAGGATTTHPTACFDNPTDRMIALLKHGFLLKHTPTSAVFLSLGHYVWGALVWPVVQCGPDVYALGTSTDASSAIWQHVVCLRDWTEVAPLRLPCTSCADSANAIPKFTPQPDQSEGESSLMFLPQPLQPPRGGLPRVSIFAGTDPLSVSVSPPVSLTSCNQGLQKPP